MKISVLTPSRGRPDKMKESAASFLDNAQCPDLVDIRVYVDSDDPNIKFYQEIPGIKVRVGPPMSVSVSWNILAKEALANPNDWGLLMMGNDDLRMRTHAWEQELFERTEPLPSDGMWCAYVDDGLNGEKHCAFPIVTPEWYHELGKFTPGIFEFFYNDTWVFDVAKKLGRCFYIPEIKMSHLHHSVTKRKDKTTTRNRNKGQHARDTQLFQMTDHIRQAEADILKEFIR